MKSLPEFREMASAAPVQVIHHQLHVLRALEAGARHHIHHWCEIGGVFLGQCANRQRRVWEVDAFFSAQLAPRRVWCG